ncbi:MAG: acyl carrier protein [Planctomyces sp.]|jgi:acyl carrier protein|nr:acyl carrier protein [Planctomyces sp.]
MPSRDEIFEKVRDTLCDALGVDEDEVKESSTLFGDLGAESIDILDILFRLEKGFGIKIPRSELLPENVTAADPNFVANGVLTPAGVAELKAKMPHADIDSFAKDPRVEKLPDLLTVKMVVNFLESKLA